MAVCGIAAFLVTIALAFLPESPKYLISKGKEVEALKVIFFFRIIKKKCFQSFINTVVLIYSVHSLGISTSLYAKYWTLFN